MKKSRSPKGLLRNIWRTILLGLPLEASAVSVWSSLSRWKVVPSCVWVVLAFTKCARQKMSFWNDFWFSSVVLCVALFFWQNIVFDSFGFVSCRCQQDAFVCVCVQCVLMIVSANIFIFDCFHLVLVWFFYVVSVPSASIRTHRTWRWHF